MFVLFDKITLSLAAIHKIIQLPFYGHPSAMFINVLAMFFVPFLKISHGVCNFINSCKVIDIQPVLDEPPRTSSRIALAPAVGRTSHILLKSFQFIKIDVPNHGKQGVQWLDIVFMQAAHIVMIS